MLGFLVGKCNSLIDEFEPIMPHALIRNPELKGTLESQNDESLLCIGKTKGLVREFNRRYLFNGASFLYDEKSIRKVLRRADFCQAYYLEVQAYLASHGVVF